MFSRQSKWLLGGSLAILVGTMSVTALAGGAPAAPKERHGKALAQHMAAKAGLQGEKATAFLKVWESSAAEQQSRRKQMKEAVQQLAAAVHDNKTGKDLSRAVDGVQAGLLSILDGQGRRLAALREVLSPAEQSRLVLGQKWPKVLALPGMKQAVPALIGFIRSEFLDSVKDLDPAARKRLNEIGDAATVERSKLLEQRLEIMQKLETAGADGKDNTALLDQLIANGSSLRETVSEQLATVRKSVPDAQVARVVLALKDKAGRFHERIGGLLNKAVTQD